MLTDEQIATIERKVRRMIELTRLTRHLWDMSLDPNIVGFPPPAPERPSLREADVYKQAFVQWQEAELRYNYLADILECSVRRRGARLAALMLKWEAPTSFYVDDHHIELRFEDVGPNIEISTPEEVEQCRIL